MYSIVDLLFFPLSLLLHTAVGRCVCCFHLMCCPSWRTFYESLLGMRHGDDLFQFVFPCSQAKCVSIAAGLPQQNSYHVLI